MRYDAFLSYSHAADGKLAPALQRALHRFARPWNRMRALRIFRDTTSLAATPELWPAIVAALGESSHFLLLASPQAAASKWVQREIEWWCTNRAADKMFVLLTEGAIAWDERTRDFDWTLTTALPDLVRGKFQGEPLYVDLTWARHQEQLDLQNARFRQAILDIAAPLHGKDKDQLDGEDVRQFRKTRRLRAAAVAGLFVLALASTTAAVVAVKQRNVAVAQTRVALSRQLAAEAVANDTRLDVAFLLAVTAHRLSETPQARAALQRLLTRTPTIRGVLASEPPEQALAFSPDGRLLASAAGPGVSASDDPGVSLWRIDALQLVGKLKPAQNRRAKAIAFHPDGKSLAVAYLDGAILLWDVASREPTGEPLKATFGATSLAFSPDGRYILSSSGDRDVVLWDVARRRRAPARLPQFAGAVEEVAFGPDGTSAAVVTREHGVTVWNVESGQLLPAPLSIAGDRVTAFAFHPDGQHWLLGTRKGLSLYDPTTQQPRRELWRNPELLEPRVLRTSANGKTFVMKTPLGSPVVFDPARTRDLNRSLDESAVGPAASMQSAFAIGPDGNVFAQSMDSGVIVLWDYSRRRSLGEVFDLEVTRQPGGMLGALLMSADALKTGPVTLVLWDAAQRRRAGEAIGTGHEEITALAFSPKGRTLATGGREGSIAFWDIETRQPVGEPLPPGGHAVEHLVFSPDGRLLASAGPDRSAAGLASAAMGTGPSRVTLWEMAQRQVIDRPFGKSSDPNTLAFSPDGRLLMASGLGKILLYDVQHRKIDGEFSHGDPFGQAAFSTDGRQVLSFTKTSLVTWDVASRRRVEEPVRGPATAGITVRLSPDGRLLARLSVDGLRLFDAATRQPLGEVIGGGGAMAMQEGGRAGFSPDGKQFVAGGVFSPDGKWLASRAGSPFVWHIDLESWLARACELVNRNLTATEWRRYAGTDMSYVKACPHLPDPNPAPP